jgi:hypothetical protein
MQSTEVPHETCKQEETQIEGEKKATLRSLFSSYQGVQWSLMANMAQRTGLEPATPGVTGRYSNRLNYRCAKPRVVGDDGIEPPTLCL